MKYLIWAAGFALSLVFLISQLTDKSKKKGFGNNKLSTSIINSFSNNKSIADWPDEEQGYTAETESALLAEEEEAENLNPEQQAALWDNGKEADSDEPIYEDTQEDMYSYIFNDFYKTYKISPDGYSIHQDVVCKNGCFSDMLSGCGVEYDKINILSKQAKRKLNIFDPKKVKPGKHYFVLCDTITQQAHYLIYEETPTEFIVFVLRSEQPDFYADTKPIESRLKTASGIIHSSLYETMEANQIDPNLAIGLSKIFATSIDFFSIHKGDRFKAVYKELLIQGKPIGVGEIQAAYFYHDDEEFYAFAFEQDKQPQYFTNEGKSMQKAFLKAPLKFSRISSNYAKNRFHPILRRNKPHLGTDYAAPAGTPVVSVGDGVVIKAARSRGNGNFIKVKHSGTYTTQYLHLKKFAKGIKQGSRVKQGDVIGYVGSTGLATGPHLCYRFWKNGKQVDPYKEKMPNATPIRKALMPDFVARRDSLLQILNEVNYQIQAEDVVSEALN